MEEFLKKDFEKLLKHNGLDAHRWMKATDSTVARVYDRNLENLNITVDLYGHYARIVDYSDDGLGDDQIVEIKDIVSRFLYVEGSNIIVCQKKKRSSGEQHEKRDESCKVLVKENGLSFECELSLYADTGLFLDQVNTRALVMENSLDKKVLNLFCYTGSFSVYAANGGAESVKSVDLSNVYSEWARRNLERNGFLDKEKCNVLTMDARTFLEDAIKNKDVYDIVIFDPPAFSNSHKAEDFDVQKDYLWFLFAINKILSKSGAVVFSENLASFRLDKNSLGKYYNVKEITKDVLAPGFSSKRRGLRVWIMEKTASVKEESIAVWKSREMDEELKDESLDRLTLRDVDDFGKEQKEEKKREKRSSKNFDFEQRRSSGRDERRDFEKRGERHDSHERYHERRREHSDSERRGYSRDRDDRRGDSRRDFGKRDDYRSDRRDSWSRGYERDDRRSYSDRDDRRGFRDHSFDRDRGDYQPRRDWRDRDQRRSGGNGERRSGNFRSQRYDGENETSRFYRGDRDDRRSFSRDSEPRKKTSKPKPFGYDSFMETKNRDKATAFWLKGQEVVENKDEY